jgi:hypothetical protein
MGSVMRFLLKLAGYTALGLAAKSLLKRTPKTVAAPHPLDAVDPTIELADDYDVTFWMRRLNVSKKKLTSAVKKVGPSVAAVQAQLAA